MKSEVITGLALPFAGTALGAGCVLFMKKQLGKGVQRALTGFAAGVMVAASIWSLLIPAMEQAAQSASSFAHSNAPAAAWSTIPTFARSPAGRWLSILPILPCTTVSAVSMALLTATT